jgi:hypothetical protein
MFFFFNGKYNYIYNKKDDTPNRIKKKRGSTRSTKSPKKIENIKNQRDKTSTRLRLVPNHRATKKRERS